MAANTAIARKAARRKPNLLELANGLGNVGEACRRTGYSREQFYEIRGNYQTFGSEGPPDKTGGPRNPRPGRAGGEQEQAVMDYCLEYPVHGALKASRRLILRGVHAGAGTARGIWPRHNLPLKHQRLLRPEQHYKDHNTELTDNHIRLLETFDPEFRERHVKADFSGELVAADTFTAGNLKGTGKIYLQTAVDCHSRFAFGHPYTSKVPVTAVHVLNDKVLPFFEEHRCPPVTILADGVLREA